MFMRALQPVSIVLALSYVVFGQRKVAAAK